MAQNQTSSASDATARRFSRLVLFALAILSWDIEEASANCCVSWISGQRIWLQFACTGTSADSTHWLHCTNLSRLFRLDIFTLTLLIKFHRPYSFTLYTISIVTGSRFIHFMFCRFKFYIKGTRILAQRWGEIGSYRDSLATDRIWWSWCCYWSFSRLECFRTASIWI